MNKSVYELVAKGYDQKVQECRALRRRIGELEMANAAQARKISELEDVLANCSDSPEDVVDSLKDDLQIARSKVKELQHQLSVASWRNHPEEQA